MSTPVTQTLPSGRIADGGAIDPPMRRLCTDCGVSRTQDPKRCASACQFIRPDYDRAESAAHGRKRDSSIRDEVHFGVHTRMLSVRLASPKPGAQWSGVTTRLAERLLETEQVTAVLTMRADPEDRWRPQPVCVTSVSELESCRGMRMGFAPLVSLLEPAVAEGHRRIAVIAIPCQVYALRSLERELKQAGVLEQLLIIGIPCSDNTSTEHFHAFLNRLDDNPDAISYLEFRTDYQVELRFDGGRVKTIPFLKLPLSDLPADFFPTTCRTCVDYVNALADITVGYMGGDGQQWVIIRNPRGEALFSLVCDELDISALVSRGKRRSSVAGFIRNTYRASGGLPLRRMPNCLRPIVGWLMPRLGPRGLEFARARVEMKAAECILHLRRQYPGRMRHMVPLHIWQQVADYGLSPERGEIRAEHQSVQGVSGFPHVE